MSALGRRFRAALFVLLGLVLLIAVPAALDRILLPRPFESRGTYLQDVTTTSAIIACVTKAERRLFAAVHCEESGALVDQPSEANACKIHELRVQSLQPDRRYRYRVHDERQELVGEGLLRSAPLSDQRPVRCAVFGDSGGVRDYGFWLPLPLRSWWSRDMGCRQAELVPPVQTLDPDLILHMGDVVYPKGSRGRYHEAFFEPFATLLRDVPIYPCLSNHDAKTESAAPFLEVFHLPAHQGSDSERYYSFDFGAAHFVCIDAHTSDLSPTGAQARWLERDLAKSALPWRIAFMHAGPRASRGRKPNEPVHQHLVPILEKHRVQLVLSGHEHCYHRFRAIGGITYIVTGGGGSKLDEVLPTSDSLAYASVDHFLALEIGMQHLTVKAVGLEGRSFDSVRIDR